MKNFYLTQSKTRTSEDTKDVWGTWLAKPATSDMTCFSLQGMAALGELIPCTQVEESLSFITLFKLCFIHGFKIKSRNLNSHNLDWLGGVEKMSRFKLRQIQLSRCYRGAVEETRAFSIDPPAIKLSICSCWEVLKSCRAIMNLHYQLVFLDRLEGFNTWSWNMVSWSI